jgi:antitoxin FitA
MPAAITLKNIPDDIYDRLKVIAKTNHRSINKEAIACLEQALKPIDTPVDQRLARIRRLRATVNSRKVKPAEILRAIDRGRS